MQKGGESTNVRYFRDPVAAEGSDCCLNVDNGKLSGLQVEVRAARHLHQRVEDGLSVRPSDENSY